MTLKKIANILQPLPRQVDTAESKVTLIAFSKILLTLCIVVYTLAKAVSSETGDVRAAESQRHISLTQCVCGKAIIFFKLIFIEMYICIRIILLSY